MNCFAVDGKIIRVIKGRGEQRSKSQGRMELNGYIRESKFSHPLNKLNMAL